MSSVRGSTSASTVLPFTFIVTWDLAMAFPPALSRGAAIWRAASARVSITPAILVRYCGRAARVGGRRGDRFGGGHRALDGRGVERRADQDLRRVLGP